MDNQENKPTRGTDSHRDAEIAAKQAELLRADLKELQSFVNDLDDGSASRAFYSVRGAIIAQLHAEESAAGSAREGGITNAENFADWLKREMPPGTVISDPAWWVPRILRAVGSDIATTTSTVSAPNVQIPQDLLNVVRLAASSILHSHRIDYLHDDDGQPYPLVDLLSKEAPDTIATGKAEIERIVGEICDEFENIGKSFLPAEGAQKAPEEVRESATDKAIQRAAGELPDGYEVVIELENGAGGVVWIDDHGERHIIEGEGHISDDINEAIDRALEHAAPDALRTSSTDQANADTGPPLDCLHDYQVSNATTGRQNCTLCGHEWPGFTSTDTGSAA